MPLVEVCVRAVLQTRLDLHALHTGDVIHFRLMQQQPDGTEPTIYANPPTKRRSSALMLIGMIFVVLIVPAALGRTQMPEPFDQSAVDDLQSSAADVVFIGNSLLLTRIDPDYLSELTGSTSVSLAVEGTAPGVWLLQLWNVVTAVENPPSEIFVFFHDDLITRQSEFTGAEDSVLVEKLSNSDTARFGFFDLSKLSLKDKIKYAFTSIYPIANSKSNQQSQPISSIGAALVGYNDQEFTDAAESTFSFANIRDQAGIIQQPKFHGDFYDVIDDSFLPELIRATDDINANLTIVRVAARPNTDGSPNEPESLARYSSDLSIYLVAKDVRYVDMTRHVESGDIDAAMYYDGYHLKNRFRQTYTEFFAEWMLASNEGKGTAP